MWNDHSEQRYRLRNGNGFMQRDRSRKLHSHIDRYEWFSRPLCNNSPPIPGFHDNRDLTRSGERWHIEHLDPYRVRIEPLLRDSDANRHSSLRTDLRNDHPCKRDGIRFRHNLMQRITRQQLYANPDRDEWPPGSQCNYNLPVLGLHRIRILAGSCQCWNLSSLNHHHYTSQSLQRHSLSHRHRAIRSCLRHNQSNQHVRIRHGNNIMQRASLRQLHIDRHRNERRPVAFCDNNHLRSGLHNHLQPRERSG